MAQLLDYVFRPKSIAVIGASTKDKTIGRHTLHNLISYDFNGPVFPVNPKAKVIHSIKSYSSVLDIPDPVDMAIIIVPKEQILQVVDECGQKGVKGLVVITAGFSETGPAGMELEMQLLDLVKKYSMRMIGPNCMGIFNSDENIRMNATFASHDPIKGNIGFISQSGALGHIILEYAKELGLGFSMFASIGNKADISCNSLLQYWEYDPSVQLILLYLESFGNPRNFTNIAKRISKTKPIITVKAGRTSAGAKAASSHTGALAGLDLATEALFEQCGVIRVTTLEELFELAQMFANQPIPLGKRVAILTNAGGPAILATDACVNFGIEIANLSNETKTYLKSILRPEASVANPVDMIASANAQNYYLVTSKLLEDDNVDMAIIIFVPPLIINSYEVAESIANAVKKFNKPVAVCFMGIKERVPGIDLLQENHIPLYSFPESAARALAYLCYYRKWQEQPLGEIKTFEVEQEKAKAVIDEAYNNKQFQLSFEQVSNILKAYGFNIVNTIYARTLEETISSAGQTGYPVVIKIANPKIIHKSDIGGVITDIRNKEELESAYNKLANFCKKHGEPPDIIIQEMLQNGKETILGMITDKLFGPLIMFGLGGIYVEVLKDVSFKIHPLTDIDAIDMVESLRSVKLLKGVRGGMPVHIPAIIETLQRLSQLISDFPSIEQLDINPFIVTAKTENSKIVDARMTLKAN